MHKDYIEQIEGAERRFFTSEVRSVKREAETEGAVIEGYAALFNSVALIGGWFREVIMPGAFDDVLNDDVRCLFNHDPNQILARCVNGKGTLELFVDEKGLGYRYTTPDRTYAKDLADAIEKGDVTQSSFAWKPKKTVWIEEEGLPDLRQIEKFEILYDVSPVTYPAYADTTVAKRSHDAYLAEKTRENDEQEQRSTENKGLSLTEAQLFINQNL